MGPYNEQQFKTLENSEELDLFLVFLKAYNKNREKQMGILLDNGYEFRFPGGDMNYIKTSDPCSNKVYDSRCLHIYNCESCQVYQNFSMYFQYNLSFFMKSENFSITIFQENNYFSSEDSGLDDYFYFMSDKSTEKVYDSSQGPLDEIFGSNISELLRDSDIEISKTFEDQLLFQLNSSDEYLDVEGLNSEYLGSYSLIKFEDNKTTSLLCITGINYSLALKDFISFFDKIYLITSIQVSIFILFTLLGLLITCFISSSITVRITNPLITIENYLRGLTTKIPRMKYNKEVNDIDKYLLILETIEQLLDPRFLLHPNKRQRLENLREVCNLFMTIKNNKGIAITKNLIGNLHLEDQDYDKAIDMYRESLSEMEALYNEVIAQEHAETKLTFEERRLLKIKTGKESQNWDVEKTSIVFNITERIQQLYLAKQLSLESSLDSAFELRAEWKSILELQTKALQHYISSSNNYINMLKVILDISYVYHKLQYFHTALELLDVVYEELSKLTPELTEQAKFNAKGLTVDIDVTRLKRLSLKVKDSDSRKLYFQVSGISFEKDILRQTFFYRRALIYKENERFHEAALYFTMAVEQGTWYDPEIRKNSVENLYQIFSKFKLIHDEPFLLNLYEKSQSKKKSTIFCLCYDVFAEQNINELIVGFVGDEVQSQIENFGAITENIDSKYWMECIERDYPGLDIENLISSIILSLNRNHVYDVVLQAIQKFPKNSLDNTLVIFCKALHDCLGPGRLQDIDEELGEIKLAFMMFDDSAPEELIDFLNRGGHTIISIQTNLNQGFEELRKLLFV
jgi:hypothetical protein